MASGRIFRRLLQSGNVFTNTNLHSLNSACCLSYTIATRASESSVFLHSKLTLSEGRLTACHVQVRHKGHSHFQNIKANKMANDSARMRIASKLTSEMAIAVKEGGGCDPKLNSRLASVISKMETSNIPKAKIQSVLERLKTEGKNYDNVKVEIKGPRGSVFVAEVFAPNAKTAKDQVRAAIKKVPVAKIPEQPAWMRMFDQVGIITVPITSDMDASNMDHYVEVAIESGAEDVIMVENTDENIEAQSVLKFHCDSRMVQQVEKEITQTHDLKVSSSEVDLIPRTWETFEDEEDIKIYEMVHERLNRIEELVRIYDNVTVPEE